MRKKHTVIVGGTRGAGLALVKLLSKNSHVLSVIGRHLPPKADRRLPDVHFWLLNLSEEKHLNEVCTEIIKQNGKLDNLVFFQRHRGEGDDWKGEMEISLTATKNAMEHFIGQFNDTRSNSVVIISSIVSHFIADEQPLSYRVGKVGIKQMVRYYAAKLGPAGIRVNSISPSTVLKDENKKFYLDNKAILDLYKRIIPLGRMGTSEDIANVIDFLCSAKSSFITGQDIVVDGGLSLQEHAALARKITSLNQLDITRKTLGVQNG